MMKKMSVTSCSYLRWLYDIIFKRRHMNVHTRRIIMALLCIYTVVMIYVVIHLIMRTIAPKKNGYIEPVINDTLLKLITDSKTNRLPVVNWCQPQRYLKDTEKRPVIALVSFPGSGNTWLRYLLQQATGVITGSIYEDQSLVLDGLTGETITNNSVSVVKTHEWGEKVRGKFDKAILLIRASGPAIQSAFNWQKAGHLGHASLQDYLNNDEWLKFVHDGCMEWRNVNVDWLVNYGKPLHVVLYNDLIADTSNVMRTVINFVELPVSSSNFRCMLRRKQGIFKRKQITRNFEPYPAPLDKVLAAQQIFTYRIVEKMIKMHTINRYPYSMYYKDHGSVASSLFQHEEFIRKHRDFG